MAKQLTMLTVAAAVMAVATVSAAQTTSPRPAGATPQSAAATPKPTPTPRNAPPAAPSPNYIIGPDDVLTVTVWREKDVSGDVVVRPDGKVTLPGVGNDIMAAGLTVDELKARAVDELKKFYEEPNVSIQVRQINSRRVYITGSVNKPGTYPLTGPMNVVQLIALAGGLQEFAKRGDIRLISATIKDPKTGAAMSYRINYDDLVKGKNLAKNNIELRPGDQVIVR